MRVAVLYICTGKYTVFWDGFFRSSELFFMRSHEKHYFVFTDGHIDHTNDSRVHRIQQKKLGWPYDTLHRFHMFSCIESELQSFDFILYINANSYFVTECGDDVLPKHKDHLLLTLHPGYWHSKYRLLRWKLPYERDIRSTAYIPYWKGGRYVCGGLNGGWRDSYLRLIRELKEAIDVDGINGIVARWHDESHLNRYALEHPAKLLHPGFMYPSCYDLPFPKRIGLYHKEDFGGHKFLRD